MLLGARQFFEKRGGGVIPALKVESSGILDCVLNQSISPPYSISLWVRQNQYQPFSDLSKSPLVFSVGGAETGSALGRSGQVGAWNRVFSGLNQPRYWVQFNGVDIERDTDWHFVVMSVKSGTYPFSLWIDDVATTPSYKRGSRAVGTTASGSHLTVFGRTTAGLGAEYDSQWYGSVANIALYHSSMSGQNAAELYENRFTEDLSAAHFWRCELTNGHVQDLVGNLDLTVSGAIIRDELKL